MSSSSRHVWPAGTLRAPECTAIGDTGRGHACFRPDSRPVILVIGSAPMYEFPGAMPDDWPVFPPDSPLLREYGPAIPTARGPTETIEALKAIGARVISIVPRRPGTDGENIPSDQFAALARASGAVLNEGLASEEVLSFSYPLTYQDGSTTELCPPTRDDIERVRNWTIDAISGLTENVPQDINLRISSHPDNPNNQPITDFLLWTRTDPDGSFDPSRGEVEDDAYRNLLPGTNAPFALGFRNIRTEQAAEIRLYRGTVSVRGDEATELDSRELYIVIPADSTQVLL